jgi:hypothetical protein
MRHNANHGLGPIKASRLHEIRPDDFSPGTARASPDSVWRFLDSASPCLRLATRPIRAHPGEVGGAPGHSHAKEGMPKKKKKIIQAFPLLVL